MASVLDLTTDPVFIDRVTLAFAAAAYQVATTPDPTAKPEVRKAQLQALVKAIDPAQAATLARKAVLLIIGSPQVLAMGDKVPDADLAIVVGKVLGAFQELSTIGGSL